MSDLKVWVDGKERVIRGVSEETTCESVVLVLAKAAGKSGKVALLEKWRDFERILPRNENPLKCLEAWGTHKKEVSLILQDDEVPKRTIDLNKDSINFGIANKYDLIKRSVDCQSLENLTALQERKLKRLSRALEILELQFSCWDDSDEKFLYLTEDELIEDFSLKLSHTLKLQAKELDKFDSWQTDLDELQKSHEKSASKFELYSDKISQLESEIADTNDVVRKLLTQTENTERGKIPPESLDVSSDIQNELRVLQHELDEQKRLSYKQDKELDVIEKSLSELTKAFQLKSSKIERLRNEVSSDEIFYDLDEHFRPLSPEEETKLYKQPLSSDSVDNELSTDGKDYNSSSGSSDCEMISKSLPGIKSGSNGSRVEDDTDFDLSRRSSTGSPEEFFRNWSSSTKLASSPLNYYHLVNGVNGMKGKSEHSWSSFPSKSKTVLQTSSKHNNGRNRSTAASNGKVKFAFSGTQDKISLDKSIDPKIATSMDAASSMMWESSTSSMQNREVLSNLLQGYYPKENSMNETILHKESKPDSVVKTSSSIFLEKNELQKQHISRTSPKPPTKPKPSRNRLSSSGLPKNTQPSTLNNQQKEISESNSVPQEHKKPEMLPPATLLKPQRKHSLGAQTSSSTGAMSLLSSRIPDKAYLLPPTVQHKRNHHRKEKALSHDDLCEGGVFV